jgi:transposase
LAAFLFAINPQVKIYLHTEPIDMRKSFDGLFGIIKSDLHLDVRDGGVFMFLNLRRNRIKLMYWDRDGIAIWMKRLETNCFQRPLRSSDGKHIIIEPTVKK